MARMIPATIHPQIRSGAERQLFGVIRDAPGTEDWACLHSLGLARHGTKRRGEIDFLLLTRKGIFVLEAKGGGIARDGGTWRFTDRYGDTHVRVESPFDQAAGAMFALEKDVRERFADEPRRTRMLFGYGVMFPDIVFDACGSESDRRLLYDARDRNQPFTAYIDRLAAFARDSDPRDRYAPTDTDIRLLIEFLRPDFDLVPALGVQVDNAVGKLLSLAQEQYAVIDAWEQYMYPRVLVQGGAGTGKTLLALEAAIRAARQNDGEILLLCYNRLLAKFLQEQVKARHPGGGVTVKPIFSLLTEIINASSLAAEFEGKRASVDQRVLYKSIYPEYAALAIIENGYTPARTLVIDEAQDMMTMPLLDLIDAFVSGGLSNGRWYVFCDVNNQASVFGSFEQAALARIVQHGHTAILATNRRNTRQVAEETTMLTCPRIAAPASVDGIPVRYSWYASPEKQVECLSQTVRRLLRDQIAPGKITVLSPRSAAGCSAAQITDPKLIPLETENVLEASNGSCRFPTYCTVSGFKGLENDFIILTDIEDLDSEWWRSVIYVGMSRARVGLHLLLQESLKTVYETRLRDWILKQNTGR